MKVYGILVILAVAPFISATGQTGNGPSSSWDIFSEVLHMIAGLAKPHIAGGHEVEPHSFPHQVALVSLVKDGKPDEKTMCGGTLIAPQWVLTAAHCTVNVTNTVARLGAHNFKTKEATQQKINVVEVITDDNWDHRSGLNDIALMKLEKPAVLNEYVQTIRLPRNSEGEKSHENEPITVVGWGKYNDSINALSPVLKSIDSKVLNNIDCTYRHGLGKIRWHHLCATSPKQGGVCPGDSGGPMLLTEEDGQRTVIGIVSFRSLRGCENSIPTVFTRVDRYWGFISRTTGLPERK